MTQRGRRHLSTLSTYISRTEGKGAGCQPSANSEARDGVFVTLSWTSALGGSAAVYFSVGVAVFAAKNNNKRLTEAVDMVPTFGCHSVNRDMGNVKPGIVALNVFVLA